ncbi:hypothetical protein OROGR_007137 [Orobanche gracilis]
MRLSHGHWYAGCGKEAQETSKENGTQNNVDCINGIAYSEESNPSLVVLVGR